MTQPRRNRTSRGCCVLALALALTAPGAAGEPAPPAEEATASHVMERAATAEYRHLVVDGQTDEADGTTVFEVGTAARFVGLPKDLEQTELVTMKPLGPGRVLIECRDASGTGTAALECTLETSSKPASLTCRVKTTPDHAPRLITQLVVEVADPAAKKRWTCPLRPRDRLETLTFRLVGSLERTFLTADKNPAPTGFVEHDWSQACRLQQTARGNERPVDISLGALEKSRALALQGAAGTLTVKTMARCSPRRGGLGMCLWDHLLLQDIVVAAKARQELDNHPGLESKKLVVGRLNNYTRSYFECATRAHQMALEMARCTDMKRRKDLMARRAREAESVRRIQRDIAAQLAELGALGPVYQKLWKAELALEKRFTTARLKIQKLHPLRIVGPWGLEVADFRLVVEANPVPLINRAARRLPPPKDADDTTPDEKEPPPAPKP